MLTDVSASSVAGVSSACISTPVDVVKTRLMNDAGHANKQYSGMLNGLVSISRDEGFVALYKGFAPIVIRKTI